jgi:hypothetical protein
VRYVVDPFYLYFENPLMIAATVDLGISNTSAKTGCDSPPRCATKITRFLRNFHLLMTLAFEGSGGIDEDPSTSLRRCGCVFLGMASVHG